MGVQGLWSILDSTGHPIKLEALEGRVLGVDATIWLYQFLKGFRDKDNAATMDGHKIGLFRRISKLLFYKIKPVFVFDGPAPLLKRRTLERRQDRRNKSLAKAQGTALKILAEQVRAQYPETDVEQLMKNISVPNLMSHHLVATNKLGDDDFEMFKLKEKSFLEQIQEEELKEAEDLKHSQSHDDDGWEQDWDSTDSDCEFVPRDFRIDSINGKSSSAAQTTTFAGAQDLSKLDIDSAEFKNLPAEVRHEILTDIKNANRRHKSTKILPDDSNSFSSFQLERLRVKRSVQEKIEEAERDICSSISSNHEFDVDLLDKKRSIVESYRVHSDPTLRMLYLKSLSDQSASIKNDINLESGKGPAKLEDIKEEDVVDVKEEKVDLTPIKASLKEYLSSIERPDYKLIGKNLARATSKLRTKTSTSPKISDEDTDTNDSFISVKELALNKVHPNVESNAQQVASGDEEDEDLIEVNETKPDETFELIAPINDSKIDTIFGRVKSPTSQIYNKNMMEESYEKIDLEPNKKPDSEYVVYHIDTDDDISIKESEDVAITDDETSGYLVNAKDVTSFVKRSMNDLTNIDNNVAENENEIEDKDCDIGIIDHPPRDATIVIESDTDTDDPVPFKLAQLDTKERNEPIKESTRPQNPLINTDKPVIYDEDSSSRSSFTQTQKYIINQIEEAKKQVAATKQSDGTDFNTIQDENSQTDHLTKEAASSSQPKSSTSKPLPKQLTLEELEELKRKVNREERHANSMTDKIIRESKELLELWGIPYIVAAGEAEAQCATLETLKLTEGTITDDSDVWLFGAKVVYKNFFSDHKYAMQFKMSDIEHHIRLDREALICIAMLVGSDYTDGIEMVGPVTALEILSEFPGKELSPLVKFKNWWKNYKESRDKIPGSKRRERFLKLNLPEEFPSKVVFDGYMQPCADNSDDKFTWGMPKLDELREYARQNFGWNSSKIDENLLPVMKKVNDKTAQTKIDMFFFRTESNKNPSLFRSKRVNQALESFSGNTASSSQSNVQIDEQKKKTSSRGRGKTSTVTQRGTKRGRGKMQGRPVVAHNRSVSDKGKSYLSEDDSSTDDDDIDILHDNRLTQKAIPANQIDNLSEDSNSRLSQSSAAISSQGLILNQAPTLPRGRGGRGGTKTRAKKRRGAFSRVV